MQVEGRVGGDGKGGDGGGGGGGDATHFYKMVLVNFSYESGTGIEVRRHNL